MDLWIVLVEDRHAGPDALPFSTEERAVGYARETAREIVAHPERLVEPEVTPEMREDGCVLLIEYSVESDRVTVLKRTVDVAE